MVEVGDKGILFPVGNKKGSVIVMGTGTPEVGDKVIVAPLGNMKGNLVAWKPGVPEVGDKALLLPSYGMKEYVLAIKEEVDELKEGDYTTWTHKWTNDVPDGIAVSIGYFAVDIDDKNDILYLFWRDNNSFKRFGVYNLADFSVVFQSPDDSHYLSGYPYTGYCFLPSRSFSEIYGAPSVSLQTYRLLVRNDFDTIEVWRGGATALWSRDTSNEEAATYVQAGMISIIGKWIIILTGTKKLICYEGS